MKKQLVLGVAGTGSPITWDGTTNYHAYITGCSGFGKTFELRFMAAQIPEMGWRGIIFDYAGDFVAKNREENWPPADTKIIDIRKNKISLNPFVPQTKKETDEEIAERVVSIFSRGIPLGSAQWAYLYDIIIRGLKDNLLMCISDLVDLIESDTENNDVAKRILPKIKILGRLLPSGKRKHNWKLNCPGITIIDMSSIKDPMALSILAEMLLWDICNQRMGHIQEDPTPVVLILDECQRLRFKEGDTTVRILREGRKYGIIGWFSTQWIDNKATNMALAQAGIRIYFRPDEESLHNTAVRLARRDPNKIPNYEIRLGNLKRGQFILQKDSRVIISKPPVQV